MPAPPALPQIPTFLVVDFHAESRYLLVRTLRRKFPSAIICECEGADSALEVLQRGPVSAIISHRTFEHSGVELVRLFRAVQPDVPIVMVSGADRTTVAKEAGAASFLHYDEWLRLGTIVQDLMSAEGGRAGRPVA